MHKHIAISPTEDLIDEAILINRLFEAGLYRYHIRKQNATEQGIAEILEDIDPRNLGSITLHTHYHLVLAYGVGGIHYSEDHRLLLQDDFAQKVNLYQSFGVKVSTDIDADTQGDQWTHADYAITQEPSLALKESIYFFSQPSLFDTQKFHYALDLSEVGSFEILMKILA